MYMLSISTFFENVVRQARELRGVEWRRVSSLSPRPRLVVDGVSRRDVVQVMEHTVNRLD